MSSKPIEDLFGGVLVAPAPADLFHIAQADGGGGYNSRPTSIALLIALLGDLAPALLNTIDELAASLGDDANFAATMVTALAGKQPIDVDLTAIAALATAAYGRGLLTLADTAALMALLSYASAAEIQAGTAAAKAIAPDQLHLAHAPQTLTDQATVTWDMAAGFNAKVTLGGNRTIGTPTNPKVGLTSVLEVIQDGTGTRVPVLPSAATFNFGAAGAPVFSTGAGKVDIITLYCRDAATPKFRAIFSKDAA